MINEITNVAIIECPDNKILNDVLSQIRAQFVCYVDDQTDEYCYELEFVSNKASPRKELEIIINKHDPADLYLQLISYRLPDEYLEHHVLKNGVWIDKIQEKNNTKK